MMTLEEIKTILIGKRLAFYSSFMGEIVDVARNYERNKSYIYCQSGEFINVPLYGIDDLAMCGECESGYEGHEPIRIERETKQ